MTVHRIAIRPWRFDDARNAAMALIPADVDVCCTMDMDRCLEPGWRPKLEAAWTPETTALYCRTVYRASVDDPTPLQVVAGEELPSSLGIPVQAAGPRGAVLSPAKRRSRAAATIS